MGSSNINFESYDASVEDWSSYVERLESYFVVNGIEDKMEVPAILSLMGATTYKLLKNLTTPNIPSELTYQDIVKLLSEHLNPKPLEMTERFRFYKRKQFEEWKNLRICGDYKVTINPGLKIEQYPLPRIEDIFAELSGGEFFFTKIDLSEAYFQMLVDEQDRHLLTINTHKGLFRYKRMNYGIALAPAVWQRAIEQVLSGIAGVHVFLDDITITGENDQEHFERLKLVLQRLEEYGLRVNKRKSEFFKKSVNYCGHTIDKFGLHKTQEKIDAITKVLNFLWTVECEKAFKALKQEIPSDRILCHYDPKLPLVLQTDASPVGIGAVLSHIMPDGSEKPAMFASRSLNKTERSYSQIDKEALSIVWGVKRFYQYLFGRHFDLVTDHKPLVSIFAPNRSLPCLSATRMVHYALFLQVFSYTIKYRNTKNHGNADALSRLPLAVDKDCEYLTEADVTNISQVELMPVTATDIARATKTDRKLFELYESLKSGTELPVSLGKVENLNFHCKMVA
ncbi:transposon Tf2-11 polyprotein [Trichonephila clavipes]|nr:transposon Tf2-11 polyprotein [Trichonephila clavipes]